MIWGYIFGGAGVFALIVGIFSVFNGRMTRKEIKEIITAEGKATRELMNVIRTFMEKIDARMERDSEEHKAILQKLVS